MTHTWSEIGENHKCPLRHHVLCIPGDDPRDNIRDYYVAEFENGRRLQILFVKWEESSDEDNDMYVSIGESKYKLVKIKKEYEFYVHNINVTKDYTGDCDFKIVKVTREEYNEINEKYSKYAEREINRWLYGSPFGRDEVRHDVSS